MRSPVVIGLLAAICLAGCRPDNGWNPWDGGDGSPDGGTPTDGDADADGDIDADADADQDEEECFESIDIVFVLDVSTTMSSMLSTLRAEIGAVWAAANEIDDDPRFGLVVFVDDVLVANEGRSYATVEAIQADFQRWYTHTSSNRQTTSTAQNTDWPENTLDALVAAAERFEWRDAATTLRVVIHATDDTFRERPARFTSGIAAEHTYEETIEALQSQLIRVASFAAHLGGPTGTVDVEPGFFTPYRGQATIPDSTSGQVYDINEVGRSTSLADAINGFVLDEICTGYVLI